LHQIKEYAHEQKVTLQIGKNVMSHGSSKGIQMNLVTTLTILNDIGHVGKEIEFLGGAKFAHLQYLGLDMEGEAFKVCNYFRGIHLKVHVIYLQ
jgi:hypothetical protein